MGFAMRAVPRETCRPRGRAPPPVWEVNSIHPGDIGIAHAVLMNQEDPVDRKTMSFSALLDKTNYRLVIDVSAAA